MPFYEYECSSCKFYVEALQKISDAPLKKCPSCGRQTLKKLVSAPVFRLKGGGWYETDFKSDKEQKRNLMQDAEPAAAKDGDAKPADTKTPDTKPAEAKPAAAPEKKKAPARPAAKKSAPPKKKPAAKKVGRR